LLENQLAQHIQIIADFWSDILFETDLYANNVMQKYLHKHAEIPFEKVHFERWSSYL
jgi:hemoglobin